MSGTQPARLRSAFTLVEMVVALAIASFVLMAVASLIGLSARSIPPPNGVQEVAISTGDFLARLAADAAVAQSVTETEAHAITFVVSDPDGMALADTVRYVWSGVAGEPLARIVNGTDRAEMLPSVSSLTFGYSFADVPTFARLVRATDASSSLQSSLASVSTSREVGGTIYAQVVAPTLPADAVAWTLERVTLSLGPSGLLFPTTVTVEIRGCDGSGLPTDAVYASATRSESMLGFLGLLPGHETFTFTGVTVPASEKLAIVIRCSGGDGTASAGAASGSGWPADAPAMASTDGGASWTTTTAVVLGHAATGTVTRLSGGESTRHIVSRLSVSLEAGLESTVVEFGAVHRNPSGATP